MTTNERALYIYNACRKAGMTYDGAIGTLGNLQGETHDFDPTSCETMYLNRYGLTDEEYTRRADAGEKIHGDYDFVHDSAGYGIAQWTWYGRKKNLLDFAKSQGKSVGDLDVQIAFMLKEMQTSYPKTWEAVSTVGNGVESDLKRAVRLCVTNYEKPANQQGAIEIRLRYAEDWAELIPDSDGTDEKQDVTEAPVETDTPTAGFDRRKVIALAEAEVGYIEKKNTNQLDDKTANAGSNNFTKYARDLDAIGDFYNGKKQGFAWCDIFVDWLFVQCFGVDNALSLLCAKRCSSGAGCTYSLNYFIAKGQYHSRNEKPEVGDQIFFGNVGNSNHTGIVYKVDDTTVYTIEGNTSGTSGVVANGGMVCKKSYARNYSQIAGYGRPAYNDGFVGNEVAEKPTETAPAETAPTETEKPINAAATTCNVALPEVRQGDTNVAVAALQAALTYLGYNTKWVDGEFGSKTKAMLMAFQAENDLDPDGICGRLTWAKLFERS